MARFNLGQEIVCSVKFDEWYDTVTGLKSEIFPKYREIYRVLGYTDEVDCQWGQAVVLEEFGSRRSFGENCFEPVVSIAELTEIREAQPEKY